MWLYRELILKEQSEKHQKEYEKYSKPGPHIVNQINIYIYLKDSRKMNQLNKDIK